MEPSHYAKVPKNVADEVIAAHVPAASKHCFFLFYTKRHPQGWRFDDVKAAGRECPTARPIAVWAIS